MAVRLEKTAVMPDGAKVIDHTKGITRIRVDGDTVVLCWFIGFSESNEFHYLGRHARREQRKGDNAGVVYHGIAGVTSTSRGVTICRTIIIEDVISIRQWGDFQVRVRHTNLRKVPAQE